MSCLTCGETLVSKRKDTRYCSRLCYRRNPDVAKRYSNRTNVYQTAHATEPKRRYQKLLYKCGRERRELGLNQDDCLSLWLMGCFYCSKAIMSETGCGLDRIDNIKGYTIDNVVPCCGDCNKIRNALLTHEEMTVAMHAVLVFRRNQCPVIN